MKLSLHILVTIIFMWTNCLEAWTSEFIYDNTLSPPSHLKDVPRYIQEEFTLQFVLKYFAEKVFHSSYDINFREGTRVDIDRALKEAEDYIKIYTERYGVPLYIKYLGYANLPGEVFVAISAYEESIIIGFNKETKEQRIYTVEQLIKLAEGYLGNKKIEETSQLLSLLKRIPSVKGVILFAPERLALLQSIVPKINNIRGLQFETMPTFELIFYFNSLSRDLEYAELLIDSLFISTRGCREIRQSIAGIAHCVRDIVAELHKDGGDPDKLARLNHHFNYVCELFSLEVVMRHLTDSESLNLRDAWLFGDYAYARYFPDNVREAFFTLRDAVANRWLNLNCADRADLEKLGLLVLYEDKDSGLVARIRDIGNVFSNLEASGIEIDRDVETNTLQAVLGKIEGHHIPQLQKAKTKILDIAEVLKNSLDYNGYREVKREITTVPGVFAGDDRYLGLIMREVLENSFHYARPQDVTVYLETTQVEGAKFAVIKVRNPIPGNVVIPKDPFKSGVSTQGTPHWGVGLSLVRTIVDVWGGSVSLEREGDYVVCQINIPILAPNRGKAKEVSFSSLEELVPGIIRNGIVDPQTQLQLQKFIVEFLLEVDIGEEDPIGFLDQNLPKYIKDIDDYTCIDEIKRVYNLIVESSTNEARYDRGFWSLQLLLYTSIETILERIIDNMPTRQTDSPSDYVTGLKDIQAELYLRLGKCMERLNNHRDKVEYYKKARSFYETYPDITVGVFGSHHLSYRDRLKILNRILQEKPGGYGETEFIAGGIEMEVDITLDNHEINFEKLPSEMLKTIETRINSRLKERIPDCPFRIQMDINGWEFISQLIIVQEGDGRKLPNILRVVQDRMLCEGIPFIRRELAEIIMEDENVRVNLRETHGEWINDYLDSIEEDLKCSASGFHFNKSEEVGASDKNLQGLPGLMDLVFLNNYMPIDSGQQYKPIRGLDSSDPLEGSGDNYRPGRNEVLVELPFSHRKLPNGNPIYSYLTDNLSRYIDKQELTRIIKRIKGIPLDREEDILRGLERFKQGDIGDDYIDLREVHLSFVLAVLAWYQKSDLGERHEYENTDLPVLGFSEEQGDACIRELYRIDESGRWDKPIESLNGKSFRELLRVIVEDSNFTHEYLSNYGSIEQYLYLVSISMPNGPNIRRIMETESGKYGIPPQIDVGRDLDDYIFGQESNDRGYRLYPAEKSPKIVHYVNNGRLHDLSAVNTKGHTVTHFVLEIPEDISGGTNGKISVSLSEKKKILRMRRIVREGLEFDSLDSIIKFIETGETIKRSHRFPRIINGRDFYELFKAALVRGGVAQGEADRILRDGLKRRTGDGTIIEESSNIKEMARRTLSMILGRKVTMFALDQILDFHEELHGIIRTEDAEAVKQAIIKEIGQDRYELLKLYFQNLYGEYGDELELIEELVVTMYTEAVLDNPVRLLQDINDPSSRIDLNQMNITVPDIRWAIKGYKGREIELKTAVIRENLSAGRVLLKGESSNPIVLEYNIYKMRQGETQKIVDTLTLPELEIYVKAVSIWNIPISQRGIDDRRVERDFDKLCSKYPDLDLTDQRLIKWFISGIDNGLQFLKDAIGGKRERETGTIRPPQPTEGELARKLLGSIRSGTSPQRILAEFQREGWLTPTGRTMDSDEFRRNPLVQALYQKMVELIDFYEVSRFVPDKNISGEVSFGRGEDSISMLFAFDTEKLRRKGLQLRDTRSAEVNLDIKVSFHGDLVDVCLIYRFPNMERAVSLGSVDIGKPLQMWVATDNNSVVIDRLTFLLRKGIRDVHKHFQVPLHMRFRFDLYERLKAELNQLAESSIGAFDPETLTKRKYWIEKGYSIKDGYYLSDMYYTAFRNTWPFFLTRFKQEYTGWRNNENFQWMYMLFTKGWFTQLLGHLNRFEGFGDGELTFGELIRRSTVESGTQEVTAPFDILVDPAFLASIREFFAKERFVSEWFYNNLLPELLRYSNEDVSGLISQFPGLLETIINRIRNSESGVIGTGIEDSLNRNLREFKANCERKNYPDLFSNLLNLFMNSIIHTKYIADAYGYRFRNNANMLRFIKAYFGGESGVVGDEDFVEGLLNSLAERVSGYTGFRRGTAQDDIERAREILGISHISNPAPDDVKRAYRKIALRTHPDKTVHTIAEEARRSGLVGDEARDFIKEEMDKAVNEFKDATWAYEILMNPDRNQMQQYMDIPKDLQSDHGLSEGMMEDGFYLGDTVESLITRGDIETWLGDIESGELRDGMEIRLDIKGKEEVFTVLDIGSRRFFVVSNKIMKGINVEILRILLNNAVRCNEIKNLAFGEGPIILTTCKRSRHPFGDCLKNRTLIMNEAYLKIYEYLREKEMEDIAQIIFQVSLEHELLHELQGKGLEAEEELLARDIKRIVELLNPYQLRDLMTYLSQTEMIKPDVFRRILSVYVELEKARQDKDVNRFVSTIRDNRLQEREQPVILALDTEIGNMKKCATALLAELSKQNFGNIYFVRGDGEDLLGKIEEKIQDLKGTGKIESEDDVSLVLVGKKDNKGKYTGIRENSYLVVFDDTGVEGGMYIPILEILTFSLNIAFNSQDETLESLYKELTGEEFPKAMDAARRIRSGEFSIRLNLPPIMPLNDLTDLYKNTRKLLISA